MRNRAVLILTFDVSSRLTYFSAKVIAHHFPIFPIGSITELLEDNMKTAMVDGHACPIDCKQLLDRCLGKIELMQRLLARFEEQVGLDIEALENAVAQQDTPEVVRLAHKVRGTSLSVSAHQLARAAEAIESSLEGSSTADLCELTEQLRTDHQQVISFVQLALRMPSHG